MPGNPLGRHINEAGERSISLVTLTRGETPDIRSINLAPVRFERLSVSLDNVEDKITAYDTMLAALNRCRESIDTDVLIVRLELRGTSPLASSYQRDRDVLLVMLQAEYENTDKLWIDSVSVRDLQLPGCHDSGGTNDNSMVAELQSLINVELLAEINLQENVAEELKQLTKDLPLDLKGLFGKTPEAEREYIKQTLLPDGARWMRRQLEADGSENATDSSTEL